VKAAQVLVALVFALALQTFVPTRFVDAVLVVVVFTGLNFGPAAGLLAGSVGGLAQDALSSGILGVSGLSKTVVGFMAGVVGSQVIVQHVLPRLLVFIGATAVHGICFFGLYAMLEGRDMSFSAALLGGQAAGNGLLGLFAYKVLEALPGMAEQRRRMSRGSIARRLD
jgi:rod shape-determining protein MreD